MEKTDRRKALAQKTLDVKNWVKMQEREFKLLPRAMTTAYWIGFCVLVCSAGLVVQISIFLAWMSLLALLLIGAIAIPIYFHIRSMQKVSQRPLYQRGEQVLDGYNQYEAFFDQYVIWKQAVEVGQCDYDADYDENYKKRLQDAEQELSLVLDSLIKYIKLDGMEKEFRRKHPGTTYSDTSLVQSLARLKVPLVSTKYRISDADIRAEEQKLLQEIFRTPEEVEVEVMSDSCAEEEKVH